MIKLTEEELKRAYILWVIRNRNCISDEQLQPFLTEKIIGYKTPVRRSANHSSDEGHRTERTHGTYRTNSRLQTARVELFLSTSTLTNKLGIHRSAYSQYELNEIRGTITLNTLAQAAEAMDCELVYSVRPKCRNSFSQVVWQKLLPLAVINPWLKNCDPKKRALALAAVVSKLSKNPSVRRDLMWSQR